MESTKENTKASKKKGIPSGTAAIIAAIITAVATLGAQFIGIIPSFTQNDTGEQDVLHQQIEELQNTNSNLEIERNSLNNQIQHMIPAPDGSKNGITTDVT